MLDVRRPEEKKRSKLKGFIFFVIVLLFSAIVFAVWVTKAINAPVSKNAAAKEFVIESGEGAGKIAEKLNKEKLIKSKFAFVFYLNAKGLGDSLQAGSYQIPGNLNIKQVAEIITKGKVSSSKITIPEGWDNEKIGTYLEEKKIATKAEFLTSAKKKNQNYWFLSSLKEGDSLEGFLYPDTYFLSKKPTANEVVEKMLANFDKKTTAEIKSKAEKNTFNFYQIVTLSSIVEREVAKPGDRKNVASVFLNRLENNMPLESCATIQYILKENKKQFTYEETRTPSEYNTYIEKGLPKGPIGNPSVDSILAVLEPATTDYLYFLSSNGNTYFSYTIDEHNEKKARYLQ